MARRSIQSSKFSYCNYAGLYQLNTQKLSTNQIAPFQSMARKNEWPLDKMCLQCDVTKKHKEDFSSSPREGAYIHSLYMEGKRFES